MLKLRREQLERLDRAAMMQFIARMKVHLRRHFPEECRRAGDERLTAAIRQGIARAEKYGLATQRQIATYITLTAVLGLDFDSGRRYPWAAEILNDADRSPAMKIAALVRLAAAQVRQERGRLPQAN